MLDLNSAKESKASCNNRKNSGPLTIHVLIINMRARRSRLMYTTKWLAGATLPRGWQLNVHRIDARTPAHVRQLGVKSYPGWQIEPDRLRRMPLAQRVSTDSVLQKHYKEIEKFNVRPVTEGEIACSLSHVRAMETVLQLDAEAGGDIVSCASSDHGPAEDDVYLVLEDDAVFDTATFLPTVLRWRDELQSVDPQWHYLSLGHARLDNLSEPVSPLLERPGYFYQAHAYLVSPRGAAKVTARDWLRNVIAWDEYLPYASCAGLRTDVLELECPDATDKLRLYAGLGQRMLSWQWVPPGEAIVHDTEVNHDVSHTGDSEGNKEDEVEDEESRVQRAINLHVRSIEVLVRGDDATPDAREDAARVLRVSQDADAATLCRSVFVVGAGSEEVNGHYVRISKRHNGALQYRHSMTPADHPTLREIFAGYRGEHGKTWWNMQTIANHKTGAGLDVHYGALTWGEFVPPMLGWASTEMNDRWIGEAPMPLVLVVAHLDSERIQSACGPHADADSE